MIAKLERKIRDIINLDRKRSALLEKKANWNKLCSALDLIGDTELAIEAYPSLCSIEGDGASYLIVYGVLQTLLLQQDAAKHIAVSLELKQIKPPKELNEIRTIRNSAAGHPTSQKENGSFKSCFISRFSLSPLSFELLTSFSDSTEHKFTHINLPQLIDIQKKYVGKLLEEVVAELNRQEEEHKKMHKEILLVDSFPPSMNYLLGKIFEATNSVSTGNLGQMHVSLIVDIIDDFKSKLEDRSEWGIHDSIDFHYQQITYPLEELKGFFNGDSKLNEKDAYIFTSFVSNQLDILKTIAKEMDEEYMQECCKAFKRN
jgi:hypothetical protein